MNQSRRDLLISVAKWAVVGVFGGLSLGCDDEREFILDAVDWKPINVFTDLALQVGADQSLNIIDVKCHVCKTIFALTRWVVGVATAVFFDCPVCGTVANAAITVATALFQQMDVRGFENAVGIKTADHHYVVRKIGPAMHDGQLTQVVTSSLSYDRKRKLALTDGAYIAPGHDLYYTNVISGQTDQPIWHVWARDGGEPRVIGPGVNLSGLHQSHKFKLQKGLWRVACVTDAGAVLDMKLLRSVASWPMTTALFLGLKELLRQGKPHRIRHAQCKLRGSREHLFPSQASSHQLLQDNAVATHRC